MTIREEIDLIEAERLLDDLEIVNSRDGISFQRYNCHSWRRFDASIETLRALIAVARHLNIVLAEDQRRMQELAAKLAHPPEAWRGINKKESL